jgi:hypothetical protein
MPMPCKMIVAMLALAPPVAPAHACQSPNETGTEGTGCTQSLRIISRADSFIITHRSNAETQPSPRPASFLRLPPQRLGNNIWFDSDMLNTNQPAPALPSEDREQSK